VPSELELVDCDRAGPNNEYMQDWGNQDRDLNRIDENYHFYKFENPYFGKEGYSFSSMTCFLKLKGYSQDQKEYSMEKLLDQGQKAEKTFVVRVKYKYNLQESETINIKEPFGSE
jgi:hypothetical protein